jgi:hypothetical protein
MRDVTEKQESVNNAKRLSALAQLIVLYAEKGVTSTSELVTLTGYTDRAIRKARAELEFRRNPGSGTPVPDAEPRFRSEETPLPLKKKGLPHTPSKEKTPPLSPDHYPNQQTTTAAASAREAADEIAKWIGQQTNTTPAEARTMLAANIQTFGQQPMLDAYQKIRAELASGKLIARPYPYLIATARGLRDQPPPGPPKRSQPVPYGALVLADGTVVSRW